MRFTKEHLWFEEHDGTFRVGLSGYAVSELGKLTYIDAENFQRVVKSGDDLFTVESLKAAQDVACPFDLEVLRAREDIDLDALSDEPENIDNWILEVKPVEPDYETKLMDGLEYARLMGMPDEDPPCQS